MKNKYNTNKKFNEVDELEPVTNGKVIIMNFDFEIYTLCKTAIEFGFYTNDEFFEFIDFISNEQEIAHALGYGY